MTHKVLCMFIFTREVPGHDGNRVKIGKIVQGRGSKRGREREGKWE